MDPIPDREHLASMSRVDIQRLCKVNHIKANMRTDEMINALCDQVSGKDVPRPHRSTSDRVVSQPPRSRLSSVSAQRAVLQPSESNTDTESTAELPALVPTTRRKAKDLQIRLGKGRPVIAGGRGARNITKVLSRASGRRTKASATLQEAPIPEEDEEVRVKETAADNGTDASNKIPDVRPSSVRPLSPIPVGLLEPSHLPTPASSHPSYSLPPAVLSALESRVVHLETPNLDARLSVLEAAMAELSDLRSSVARIPVLQDEIERLKTAQQHFDTDMAEWRKTHTELKNRTASLEVHVKGLVVENGALKEQVTELEEKLRHHDDLRQDASMSSVIIHSPSPSKELIKDMQETVEVVGKVDKRTIPNDELPYPSPARPTLGKRARSETPDASLTDIEANGGPKSKDAEMEEIYRVIRPQRKRQRVDTDVHEGTVPFQFFRDGPSSTSTPQRPSDPSSGFFTAGRPAPTPLPRMQEEDAHLRLDKDESMVEAAGASSSKTNALAGPSASPGTRLSKTEGHMPVSVAERRSVVNVHDPAFFSGLPGVTFPQTSQLPFPLIAHPLPTLPAPVPPSATAPSTPLPSAPSTPANAQDAQDVLERSAQFATPVLGEPWRFEATVTPSQRGDGTEDPATPGDQQNGAFATGAPGSRNYTFRAGGRRERNDTYNPYFSPSNRGPGASPRSPRTGITPTRGFSFSLRSPPAMETVPEVAEPTGEGVLDEDGVRRSPPSIQTLYGTELEGDNRFGEYDRGMGRFNWRNLLPG